MKKMFICCGVLCMTLLLFCGTALAAVTVKPGDDANVTVTADEAGQEITVTKKSGAEADQLYLVMIQKGDASAKPTAENLYYLDVDKATGATFEKKAYPKDMTEAGDYAVFLSDYSGSNNGARKLVATITVGDDNSGGGGGGGGTGDVKVVYGDVNGDGTVNGKDRIILSRYLAKWADYGLDKTDENYKVILENADLNSDKQLTGKDRIILSRNLAKWADYQTLPMPES